MKKTGIVLGFLGAAFSVAVFNKMQKINPNKDSVKGKIKEVTGEWVGDEQLKSEGTIDQLFGASKEVLKDTKHSISSLLGAKKDE